MDRRHPQLNLVTAMALISFVVAPVVAYFSAQASTQKDISAISERVKGVETFVPTIDNRLKNIERALKINYQVISSPTIDSEIQ